MEDSRLPCYLEGCTWDALVTLPRAWPSHSPSISSSVGWSHRTRGRGSSGHTMWRAWQCHRHTSLRPNCEAESNHKRLKKKDCGWLLIHDTSWSPESPYLHLFGIVSIGVLELLPPRQPSRSSCLRLNLPFVVFSFENDGRIWGFSYSLGFCM